MDVLYLNRILPSDFILMVWDSDASDIDESELSVDEISTVRLNFEVHLKDVIFLLKNYTPYIAIGGPIVLVCSMNNLFISEDLLKFSFSHVN